MSIQQNVNSMISVASFLFSQSPIAEAHKTKVKEETVRKSREEANKEAKAWAEERAKQADEGVIHESAEGYEGGAELLGKGKPSPKRKARHEQAMADLATAHDLDAQRPRPGKPLPVKGVKSVPTPIGQDLPDKLL